MNEFHKEMLGEILNDWSPGQIDDYIYNLEKRATDLDDWIKHLKVIRRKQMRKAVKIVLDNGTRGGK